MIDDIISHIEYTAKCIERGAISPKETAEDMYLWAEQLRIINTLKEK